MKWYHYFVIFTGNISDVVGKGGRILGVVIFIFNIIKPDQLKTLSDLDKIHDYVSDTENKNILFVGDFNVIFYSFLEARGRTPSLENTLKQKKFK